MEKILIQGKGENQCRMSVNVPDDVDRMMQTILKEGTEDWTDRDFELYKAAERRLRQESLAKIQARNQAHPYYEQPKEKEKKETNVGLIVIVSIIAVVIGVVIILFGDQIFMGAIIFLSLVAGCFSYLTGRKGGL